MRPCHHVPLFDALQALHAHAPASPAVPPPAAAAAEAARVELSADGITWFALEGSARADSRWSLVARDDRAVNGGGDAGTLVLMVGGLRSVGRMRSRTAVAGSLVSLLETPVELLQ